VLQNDMQNAIDSVGSEEDFLRVLWEENGCRTLELYKYLCDTSYLANATFNKLYGENGELMSDEDLADYTSMDGFLMAKHILCLKQDDDEGAAKAEAESILASLNSYNGNDFDSFFDELMLEYSDDSGGLQSYPDGYLFQPGDMVPSFTEACAALDIGSYSGLVESDYGYHIIYRLPIDYDAIPFANYMQNDYSPLRYLTATSLFNSQILLWRDMLAPEYTSEYDSIEIADLFAWQ
ncbi:MAG: peptidyl-prolyl cis-trans isomerase, partial [Oscillospiraceae bacterium]|nr:peptidyl-prolyl cis-trans isomerase [Oscillospiraceae bacterium]